MSERRRAKRKVNQRFLTAMVDMGILMERAELALCETGNVGIEVCRVCVFLSVCFRAASRHSCAHAHPVSGSERSVPSIPAHLSCPTPQYGNRS